MTVVIDGGYKVNSTKVSIVNGQLFELIDEDDKLAHTTGAFMDMCDFSGPDSAKAFKGAEESGDLMRVVDGRVSLAGKELRPIGMFMPSKVTLLDSGFSLYDWSDFHESAALRFGNVLVVDDNRKWLESVQAEFGEELEVECFQTNSAHKALAHILKLNPEVLLLDMHLTEEEKFEGLWIANQLTDKGFSGKIMITSSYGPEALRAMQTLIRGSVEIPGKDLANVRHCLRGKSIR